jgi:oligosaccharide repeat unit polymerase
MVAWTGYTLSAMISCFAVANNYYYHNLSFVHKESSILPLLCVLIVNLIFSVPFIKVDERKIDILKINIDTPVYKNFVKYSLLLFFVVSILRIYESLALDTVSSYGEIYQEIHDEDSQTLLRDILYSNPLLRILSGAGGVFCSTMAPLMMMYFFKKISIKRKMTIEYMFCIIIIIIPVILQGVINASRGNIFFSLFQLLFYYILIKKYLSKYIRMYISLAALIAVAFFSSISYLITESRVETRGSSYTAFEDVMMYFGQPTLNACYFQDRVKNHPMGKRMLNIRDTKNDNSSFRDYWEQKTGAQGQIQLFKTCYGDLYLEFGLVGAFLFIIVYSFIWDKTVIKHFKNPVYIPFLWIYFNSLVYGIFNFKIVRLTDIWMVLLIIMCIYINSTSKYKKTGSVLQ